MQKKYIIAIDGMAASGKSTLACQILQTCDCNIFHTDDFFLPPRLKTKARLLTPGGNFHYERFYDEVVFPLLNKKNFTYNAYSCRTLGFSQISVSPKPVAIFEGSYSSHPYFMEYINKLYFLKTSKETQRQRIIDRGQSSMLESFEKLWIPLENNYFYFHKVEQRADQVIIT